MLSHLISKRTAQQECRLRSQLLTWGHASEWVTCLASVAAADKAQAVSLLLLPPRGALYGNCRHRGSIPLVQHYHWVLLIRLPHNHIAGSALN